MDKQTFFIIGIKGVAMCHIAVILKKMGKNVAGADVAQEFITDEVLKKNDIVSQTGFEATSLPTETEVVIFSAAHGGRSNPLVQEAVTRGIEVVSQADFLGELISQFKISIAVCGTHGKTTTSSLLAYALINLGAKPSYMIGSSTFSGDGTSYAGGDFQSNDYFVIEADEYAVDPPSDKTPKFLQLSPSHILALNVDFDHPDVYADLEGVKQAFTSFLSQDAKVIYCHDDPVLADIVASMRTKEVQGFGLSVESDLRIVSHDQRGGKTIFSIRSDDDSISDIELSLYGEKNVSNAAGVIAVLLQLGFAPGEIKRAVTGFTGPKRRLELKYEQGGTYLFDDYAHHPAEIEATISALRSRIPGKRIIVIFQPHTFSRTKSLLREFTTALAKSDMAFVLPIFASARERADATVSSADLSNGTTVFALENNEAVTAHLAQFMKPGDIIVTMGAGDVYKLETDIIEVIKRYEHSKQ
ncbi:UDP-N-acetylmuramate--L-alanine ligase [Candidatus Microgenomates bacterium]|nr:UDP-N-acetylmuramate--L-alanine ligase [Candidatus Microgenomates bacterium]